MGKRNLLQLSNRATLIYLAFGLAWILLSDTWLAATTGASAESMVSMQIIKGVMYVLITALALYLILRRLELQKAHQTSRLEYVSNNARDLLFHYQLFPTPCYRYVSPSSTELLGYAPHEFYADPYLGRKIVHPLDRELANRLQENPEEYEQSIVIRLLHRDGSLVWIEQRARLNRDENGQPIGIDGIARDITAQKETELALKETLDELDTLLESSPFPIVSASPQGNVRTWNSAAEHLFGWSESEIRGKPLPLFDTADELHFLEALLDVTEQQNIQQADLLAHRKEQDPVDIRIWFAPLRHHANRVDGVILIIRDISEEKKRAQSQEELQQQLVHAQKMEAVGRLASGVAHDFNNALASIFIGVDLVETCLDADHPARQYLEEIIRASRSASGVARQLLSFSKLQVSRPKPLDACESVRSMERMLGRLLGEDITLRIETPNECDVIRFDPVQLEQVLVNLTLNARDAMPAGGELAILLEENRDETEPRMRIIVRDTGSGIAPEHLGRVFEPFFTTKERGMGTGLGLSSVKALIETAGGRIDVKSTLGKGTSFIIDLPLLDESPELPSGRSERESPDLHGNETVLLVETERPLRRLVAETLQLYGYRVLSAGSAADALAQLDENPAPLHLVITDLTLPDASGEDLRVQIAERMETEPEVLFVTSYGENGGGNGQLPADSTAQILTKPYTARELLRRVRSILD